MSEVSKTASGCPRALLPYCQNFLWTDEQFSCLGVGGEGAIYTVQ